MSKKTCTVIGEQIITLSFILKWPTSIEREVSRCCMMLERIALPVIFVVSILIVL